MAAIVASSEFLTSSKNQRGQRKLDLVKKDSICSNKI